MGQIYNETIGAGSGTVTSVSVATANGISGTVANPTSTPAITLALGAIAPSSAALGGATIGSNALAVTGTSLFSVVPRINVTPTNASVALNFSAAVYITINLNGTTYYIPADTAVW